MRKLLCLVMPMLILLLVACDVHEWPEPPKHVKLHLHLNYETGMTEWKHQYDGTSIIELGLGKTYDNTQKSGKIRYIIRTYPISEKKRTMQDSIQEFVFTKDIDNDGYDYKATLDILPGNYNIMVWSDLLKPNSDTHFYNADNFAEIILHGDSLNNTDYRDAFYGKKDVTIYPNNMAQRHDTIDVTMKRSLAKFEIIANDLFDFVKTNKEDIDQYKVVIQYVGFMPNAYSVFTNKLVDSSLGVIFESSLRELNQKEASMGFDYVFLSKQESAVTIKIGIYEKDGTQVSMTKPIRIPLRPSHHTILTGGFLMQNASGGININPGFDGNHNLVL